MPKTTPTAPANPTMQATLAVLALLLAAFTRAAPNPAAKTLLAKYTKGMMAQFSKYKIPFPKAEFKVVNTEYHSGKTRTSDYFWNLQAFTKKFAPVFKAKAAEDGSLNDNMRKFINDTFSMTNTGDLDRHKKIEVYYLRSLRYLEDPKVRAYYKPKFDVPETEMKQVQELVRKTTGKAGYFLTPDQKAALKKKNAKMHQIYDDLHKPLKTTYNLALKKIITDGKPIPITEARKKLDALGVKVHYVDPQMGALGIHVNDINKLFTKEGRELQGNIKPGMVMIANPNYNPKDNKGAPFKYYDPAKMIPDEKNPGKMKPENLLSMYTTGHVEKRKDKKDENHENDEAMLPSAMAKWRADFRNSDVGENEYKYILGLMTEILFQHAQRIGNPGNATINKQTGEKIDTQGLTTLKISNLKIGKRDKDGLPTKITILYPGKDNVQQGWVSDATKGREQKEIVEGLDWCMTDYNNKMKPKDAYLFTYHDKRITSGDVGHYIKGLGISKTHSFRHLKAEKLAAPILKAAPKTFETSKDANKWLKTAMVPVGEALGHIRTNKEGTQNTTSATAVKSYLSRPTLHHFFTSRKLIIPDEHK